METVWILEINNEPFKWFESESEAENYAEDNLVSHYYDQYEIYALDKGE